MDQIITRYGTIPKDVLEDIVKGLSYDLNILSRLLVPYYLLGGADSVYNLACARVNNVCVICKSAAR